FSDYLYLLLNSIQIEIERKFFHGTGLKHLQKNSLRERAIYIPTADELENFNTVVQPCFDMISKNLRENFKLETLRDFLLPMLMNGQVKISAEN
ncbi:MAG: hypothetical protein IJS29_03790, partial [Selenomonadaceae bacterium]|nr:hypothetical protein [Selenomonadaceae bacterium]